MSGRILINRGTINPLKISKIGRHKLALPA